jgi:hypothetical protein
MSLVFRLPQYAGTVQGRSRLADHERSSKRGRPRKDDARVRSCRVVTYLTNAEYAELYRLADRDNRSVSSLVHEFLGEALNVSPPEEEEEEEMSGIVEREAGSPKLRDALRRAMLILGVCAATVHGSASPSRGADETELAKQSQNPVADLISVPFENNLYFDFGPTEEIANVLNLKPVIPVRLTDKVNLINRLIVPFIYLEGQDSITKGDPEGGLGGATVFPGTDDEFGLGNITYQAFFSPAEPGPAIWGIGPTIVMPTSTDSKLGGNTWSAGPNAVVLAMPGSWVIGFLGQHVWSFAEHGSEPDVNSTLLQPIVNYNIAKGWYLSSVPVITANWEIDDEWTGPLGGGVGRLVRIGGKLPVDFKLAAYYNVEKPGFAPEWNLQFTVKLLLPKALFGGGQ